MDGEALVVEGMRNNDKKPGDRADGGFMHGQLPSVTIGIPVYIGAATFATVFETLAAQNYAHLEIINSGNASADGAPTIYVEYKHVSD